MVVVNDNLLGCDVDSLLVVGDLRVNVQFMLIVFYILFVWEYNRFCDEFKNKYLQVNSMKKIVYIIVFLVV